MNMYSGSGGTAPCIHNQGTMRTSGVSFILRQLYPAGKRIWCELERRLAGPRVGLHAVQTLLLPGKEVRIDIRSSGTSVMVSYRRFGTTYRSHPQGSSSQRGIILGLLGPYRSGVKGVPKRRWLAANLRCVTSKKGADFTYAAGGSLKSRKVRLSKQSLFSAKYGHTVWANCRVIVWSKKREMHILYRSAIQISLFFSDGCKGSHCCAFTRLDGIWGTESTKLLKYLSMHNSKNKHFLENENLCFYCAMTADFF